MGLLFCQTAKQEVDTLKIEMIVMGSKLNLCCLILFLAPRVTDVSTEGATVEWSAVRPMGSDNLIYCLQMAAREHDYKKVNINGVIVVRKGVKVQPRQNSNDSWESFK